MLRNKGKLYVVGERKKTAGGVADEVDALFRLPLAEFTSERNSLAAALKKSGRGDEAVRVKALAKPPISAWAVNQLYWNHRREFDRLIAAGEHFQKAQTSRVAGKLADMRTALNARREALTQLSDLATSLLQEAGQSPSLDTIRRITSTLEAMSAMSVSATRSDGPRPGRLTHDVDPPGFGSLSSFTPDPGMRAPTKEPARSPPAQKSGSVVTNTPRKVVADAGGRQLEATRKAGIAAAKVSLHDAKKELSQARARALSLQAAQKKVNAEANEAGKKSRQAKERWEKARAASEDAAERARSVAVEVKEAAKAAEDARRSVERASEELDKLFRESS